MLKHHGPPWADAFLLPWEQPEDLVVQVMWLNGEKPGKISDDHLFRVPRVRQSLSLQTDRDDRPGWSVATLTLPTCCEALARGATRPNDDYNPATRLLACCFTRTRLLRARSSPAGPVAPTHLTLDMAMYRPPLLDTGHGKQQAQVQRSSATTGVAKGSEMQVPKVVVSETTRFCLDALNDGIRAQVAKVAFTARFIDPAQTSCKSRDSDPHAAPSPPHSAVRGPSTPLRGTPVQLVRAALPAPSTPRYVAIRPGGAAYCKPLAGARAILDGPLTPAATRVGGGATPRHDGD